MENKKILSKKILKLLKNAPKEQQRNWRNTKWYRLWRAYIILTQKKCQICGSIKNRVAHHINSGEYFPEQRYDVNNGICLCLNCHIQFHTNYKKSFREKCTSYDWNNFLSLIKYFRNKFGGKK